MVDFNLLPDEIKVLYRLEEYTNQLLEKVVNTHNIECNKCDMELWKILYYGYTNGTVGFALDGESLIFGSGSYTGTLKKDGTMDKYLITFEDGTTKEITIGYDGVVFRYNKLGFSYLPMLKRYASMLGDADLSQDLLIKYSRLLPIPIIKTEQEKNSFMDCVKNLFVGKMAFVKRDTKAIDVNNLVGTGDTVPSYTTFDLTNPQASEYIQHLSRYHDELLIRFCLENGIMITARDKGAQLNDEELTAFENYCAIGGMDLTEQLEKLTTDLKEVLGIEFKARPKDFITSWIDKGVEEDGNTKADISETEDNTTE